MKINKIIPILLCSLLLAGCGAKKPATENTSTSSNTSVKILINELPLAERPFSVLVPHTTGRLFTFYTQGANMAESATLDLEYQSGDLLKAARATLQTPISNPYIKAIILGSCSTGGKCSFDKDLATGTMKFKLMLPNVNAANLLKGDFTFVTGNQTLPDGKVSFVPAKANAKDNIILMNSLGLPKAVSGEVVLYPVIISSTSNKNITGELTLKATGVTSAQIYDGTSYSPIKYTEKDGSLVFSLNQKPWSMPVTITRDDEKGVQESVTLYILGPIVLLK